MRETERNYNLLYLEYPLERHDQHEGTVEPEIYLKKTALYEYKLYKVYLRDEPNKIENLTLSTDQISRITSIRNTFLDSSKYLK